MKWFEGKTLIAADLNDADVKTALAELEHQERLLATSVDVSDADQASELIVTANK